MPAFPLIRVPELTRLTWMHVDRLFGVGNDNSEWVEHERNVRMVAVALCQHENPGMDLDVDFRKMGKRRQPAVSVEVRDQYLRRAREMLEGCEPRYQDG